jgi:uncharacterized repeat protein (TIGR03803 family)
MSKRWTFAVIGVMTCLALSSCSGSQSSTQPPPPPAPVFSVLYSFTGAFDGANPNGPIVRDAQGNLYGTTQFGADLNCNISLHPGCGTVFRLDTTHQVTALYTFSGGTLQHGAGVVLDTNGNLYGSASPGLGFGLLYRLDPNGNFTDLYDFAGGSDGNLPASNLLRDGSGNIYGATVLGGGSTDPLCPNGQGCGTLFELVPSGQYKIVYSFLNNSDGSGPQGIIRDKAGNLFGPTAQGGQGCVSISGCGTIFKVDVSGNKTTLYMFKGGSDGSTPSGLLAVDSIGNLYGITAAGGDLTCPYNRGAGCGVVFKVDTHGVETVLHAFHGGSDAFAPVSIMVGAGGNLYGTTAGGPNASPCGAIFELDTLGKLSYLHTLNGNSEGCGPVGGLVEDSAGDLYGVTALGGSVSNPNVCYNGCGTVFEIKP